MADSPCILFTAFEPSGDEHAAPVIAELRERLPGVPIFALGGPKMRAAGATLIEETTGKSAMLAGALGKVKEQLALRRRFAAWLKENSVAIHVPTDSPAANWWFCKKVKGVRVQAAGVSPKVIHYVAPQVWAWAEWRVNRLKKWSDLVLCVLPFEPEWFEKRGVKAVFVGHPLFDEALDDEELKWQGVGYPAGSPKLAMLPGSREGEIKANWPVMLETFRRLAARYPQLAAVVAAADEPSAKLIRELTGTMPANMRVAVAQPDAAIRWADVALTVSGTITLHVARHRKPMAILYRVSPVQWHALGRWLIDTRTFTLPNLIAAGPSRGTQAHIVREFVPFLGGPEDSQPIVEELASLIENAAKREKQIASLDTVAQKFAHHHAGHEAARVIAEMYPR